MLGREAVDAPDKFFSELVVQSHYPLAPMRRRIESNSQMKRSYSSALIIAVVVGAES